MKLPFPWVRVHGDRAFADAVSARLGAASCTTTTELVVDITGREQGPRPKHPGTGCVRDWIGAVVAERHRD